MLHFYHKGMTHVCKRQPKFIEDTKSRNVSFRKRRDGLKKRGHELDTLCGIQLMLIIYDPNGTVDTWPAEHDQVKDAIKRYQKVRGAKGEVSLDLHDYFKEQIRKKESQLFRITKDCSRLESSQKNNMLDIKAMKALARRLDLRIDVVKDRINALTTSHEIDFEHNNSCRELIIHQETYQKMANPRGVEHEWRSPVGGEVGVEQEWRSPVGGEVGVEQEWRSPVGGEVGVEQEWSTVFNDIFDDPLIGTTDQFYFGLKNSEEIDSKHNNSSGELMTRQESYQLITHQENYHNGYLMADPQGLEHEWRSFVGGEVGVEHGLSDLFAGCYGGEIDNYHNGYLMVNPQGVEHEWSPPIFDDAYQKLKHQDLELACVVDHYNRVFANALCEPLIDTDNQIRDRGEAFFYRGMFTPWQEVKIKMMLSSRIQFKC